MENEHTFYPDFDHPAPQLSAFSLCIDTFIIALKNGEIVHFKPIEIARFKEWLNRFKIRDIALDSGIPPANANLISTKLTHGFFNPIKRNKRNERKSDN